MARLDRFQVAHFTDHDDIRVLAQRAAQRRRERTRVLECTSRCVTWQPAALMMYSMGSSSVMMWSWRWRLISCIERGQRGRFAAADRTRDQHEAVVVFGQFLENFLADPSSSIVLQVGGDDAENEVDAQPLPDHAGTEAPKSIGVRKIHVANFLQALEQLRLVQEGAVRRGAWCLELGQTRGEAENGFQVAVAAARAGAC